MELVLYQYWRSSSSYRVRFALALKGLAYTSRAVNLLHAEHVSAEHLVRSPMGTVPCLLVGGRPLTESIAILEYLEETVPDPPLMPREPWLRARVRQLVEIVNSGIQPLHNLSVLRRVSGNPADQQAWARGWIERGLAAFEAVLVEVERETGVCGRYSVGDDISLADVVLLPQMYQARRFGASLEAVPRVVAIDAALRELPEAREAAPEAQADAVK